MKSPFKLFLLCCFISFTLSNPILPTSIEDKILLELEEELDAVMDADNNNNGETDEKPKIDYSKYGIPGLTDDGLFNGQKVVSITEIGDDPTAVSPSNDGSAISLNLKSETPLETVTPVKSVQEIAKMTPLKNVQEIVSMEEVLKMTPISDEVALEFLKQMELKSGSDPESKSSLIPAAKSSLIPAAKSSLIPAAKSSLIPKVKSELGSDFNLAPRSESESQPEPKQSLEDELTLDSRSLPIEDLGDYQRILKFLGINRFANIKKITPLVSPVPYAIVPIIPGVITSKSKTIEEEIVENKGFVKILENGIQKEDKITNYLDGKGNKLIQKLNKLVEIKNKHKQRRNEEVETREAVKKVIEAKEMEKVKKIEHVKKIQEVTNKAPVKLKSLDEEAKILDVTDLGRLELTEDQAELVRQWQKEFEAKNIN